MHFFLIYSTLKKHIKCSELSEVLGTSCIHYSFVPLCAISKVIQVFIWVEIVIVKRFELSNLKPAFFFSTICTERD